MNRMYQVDCKRGLCSTGFYVGIVLCFLAGAFGMGTFCSHGVERTHMDGVKNTAILLAAYVLEG